MKGLCIFFILFSGITFSAVAQGNTQVRQTLILHLKPMAAMRVANAGSGTSVQVQANKDLMLNVSSGKSAENIKNLNIQAADGKLIPVNSNPASLFSNGRENTLAIHYQAGPGNSPVEPNVVFTLTNR